MKILYGVQATGNGHIMRLRELLPYLKEKAEVDILSSGLSSGFKVDAPVIKKTGLYFTYKAGGLDYVKSVAKAKLFTLVKDINSLPVEDYDLVISDFEPITSWACKTKGVPYLSMSHQACFASNKTPRPDKRDFFAEGVLAYYAPYSDNKIGFHFESYDNFIYPPPIRKEIRESNPEDLGHHTVYLAAYSHKELVKIFSNVREQFQVFSGDVHRPYTYKNVHVFPASVEGFTSSLIRCRGVICGAGFETPSEALHLGKKILAIPIKGQYEQSCNAAALKKLGVMTSDIINTDVINDYLKTKPVHKFFETNIRSLLNNFVFNS